VEKQRKKLERSKKADKKQKYSRPDNKRPHKNEKVVNKDKVIKPNIKTEEDVSVDNLPNPRVGKDKDKMEGYEEMAKNDPAQDAMNPPGNLSHDFEDFTFGSLEIAEVFWQTNQPGDNIPWRKMSITQAMNLKKGTLHNFIHNTVVWQKI